MTTVATPIPQFFDRQTGAPLQNGMVYIGTANANPETSPVAVYWDAALTQPADQPLRTINGFIARSGAPAQVYVSVDHSMTVKTAAGELVLYARTSADYNLGQQIAALAATIGSVEDKANEWYSVWDSGAVGNGSTDDTAAFIAAGAATTGPVLVPVTSSYYSLTALASDLRARLWGPGEVRVNGTVTTINTSPPTVSATKGMLTLRNDVQAPTASTALAAVGRGLAYLRSIRTGGNGHYGNLLQELRVTADLVNGELDVGATSWVSMDGDMVAGSGVFGMWAGANTPPFDSTWTGGGVVGLEVNVGMRDEDHGKQNDVGLAPYTVGLQVVPDIVPTDNQTRWPVTMTSGTPGTVNRTAHGFDALTPIRFYPSTGTMPAALTAGTIYYVSPNGLTADAFRVTATLGGADINFASSSTGAPYALPSFPGTFAVLKAASIWEHRWHVGELTRYDTLMAGGIAHQIAGGSSASYHVPDSIIKALGYWVNGIDLSGGAFSGAALKLGVGQTVAGASAGGGDPVPATVHSYLKVDIGGVIKGIALFDVP